MRHAALLAGQFGRQRQRRQEVFAVAAERFFLGRRAWHRLAHGLRQGLGLVAVDGFQIELQRHLVWRFGRLLGFAGHLLNHGVRKAQPLTARQMLGDLLVIHAGVKSRLVAAEQAVFRQRLTHAFQHHLDKHAFDLLGHRFDVRLRVLPRFGFQIVQRVRVPRGAGEQFGVVQHNNDLDDFQFGAQAARRLHRL